MGYDLDKVLVVGISSRALFDLEKENEIFQNDGLEKYIEYQLTHEKEILKKGTAFYMVEALLKINKLTNKRLVEVVIMSKNSPDTGMRVFNSISEYNLDITRAAFSGGEPLHTYLQAFSVDLFLSKSIEDVEGAVNSGVAAAVIYNPPKEYEPSKDEVRIAFDGDAVLFSEESEKIFQEKGLEAFIEYEKQNQDIPLNEGPFAKLLKVISTVQKELPLEKNPFRLALVTARNSPSHIRVVNTLRSWNIKLDEAFFLGGIDKDKVLKAFKAHIFFDDQDKHLSKSSKVVPSGRVPYKKS
jgi:5'-nucleotidase